MLCELHRYAKKALRDVPETPSSLFLQNTINVDTCQSQNKSALQSDLQSDFVFVSVLQFCFLLENSGNEYLNADSDQDDATQYRGSSGKSCPKLFTDHEPDNTDDKGHGCNDHGTDRSHE